MDKLLAFEKEKILDDLLSSYKRVVVAFSGGVDSTYLLFRALKLLGKNNVLAITAHSELHLMAETDNAEKTARGLGANHLITTVDLLALPQVRNNERERCYYCKKRIFGKLKELATQRGFGIIVEGSNADDLEDFRPGMRALRELEVSSPLLEAGLRKQEIRKLAAAAELLVSNKLSSACMASRFSYGQEISSLAINRLIDAEEYLRNLGVAGNLRVRLHPNQLVRIEVEKPYLTLLLEKQGEVADRLLKLGYRYITIDLQGFMSGSMNK